MNAIFGVHVLELQLGDEASRGGGCESRLSGDLHRSPKAPVRSCSGALYRTRRPVRSSVSIHGKIVVMLQAIYHGIVQLGKLNVSNTRKQVPLAHPCDEGTFGSGELSICNLLCILRYELQPRPPYSHCKVPRHTKLHEKKKKERKRGAVRAATRLQLQQSPSGGASSRRINLRPRMGRRRVLAQ